MMNPLHFKINCAFVAEVYQVEYSENGTFIRGYNGHLWCEAIGSSKFCQRPSCCIYCTRWYM